MIKDLFISANLIITIEPCEKILVLLEDNFFFIWRDKTFIILFQLTIFLSPTLIIFFRDQLDFF